MRFASVFTAFSFSFGRKMLAKIAKQARTQARETHTRSQFLQQDYEEWLTSHSLVPHFLGMRFELQFNMWQNVFDFLSPAAELFMQTLSRMAIHDTNNATSSLIVKISSTLYRGSCKSLKCADLAHTDHTFVQVKISIATVFAIDTR